MKAWDTAFTWNSIAAYQAYRSAFPEGNFVGFAEIKIGELRQEKDAKLAALDAPIKVK